jgi:hypothetical protein
MIEQATTFPDLVKAQPVDVLALVTDYQSTVPGIPPTDVLERTHQQRQIRELGSEYLELQDYKANLQFVLDHFPQFQAHQALPVDQWDTEKAKYRKALEEVGTEIDRIVASATDCSADVTLCPTYTRGVELLTLPTLEDDLGTLKGLQDRLSRLEEELDRLRRGQTAASRLVLEQSPGDGITSDDSNLFRESDMLTLQSTKITPPSVHWAHSQGGGEPMRYAYIQGGDFSARKALRIGTRGENGAEVDIDLESTGQLNMSGNAVNIDGGSVSVSTDMTVDGAMAVGGNVTLARNITVEGRIRGALPFSKTYVWEQDPLSRSFDVPQPGPVKMIRSDQGFCMLSRVQGHFEGDQEWVRVYVGDDGYWYLQGNSRQEGVRAEAYCVGDV